MKVMVVNDMFECPFKYTEVYQISEFTAGSDNKCTLTHTDCWQKDCPLKKEGKIKVVWNVKS